MLPSLLAAVLFSVSVIAANRSARLMGANAANFWRAVVAVVLLAAWGHIFGVGFGGGAFGVFFLSGCVGFGLGDIALFQTLPRLGPRLSSLLINCLAAPFAALIEWLWLGTVLSPVQILCGAVILAGVGLALAPEAHLPIAPRTRWAGIGFGIVAGFGQGYGAVLSRKGYAVVAAAGQQIDGGTAAYQRILGGLLVISAPYLWLLLAEKFSAEGRPSRLTTASARAAAWRWVFVNGLAGPTVGVGFYQWALKVAPSGVVLPIVSTTPLLIIPLTYFLERDRPSRRALAGGVLAVAGVIALSRAQ